MIVIVVAILIVMIMAMYIKPLVTGKEAKLIPDEISGLFGGKNESLILDNASYNGTFYSNNTSEINETINLQNLSFDESNLTNDSKNINFSSPGFEPWNGSPVTLQPGIDTRQKIVPREYIASYQRYSFKEPAVNLKTFSTINGQYSQLSSPVFIPSKYWELWYTVDLPENLQNPILEEVDEDENIVQSLSALNPYFKIIVKNLDTNEVKTIIPEGGLDPKVWKGTFGRGDDEIPYKETYSGGKAELDEIKTEEGDEIQINWDPRPWKEKFFEGYHSYSVEVISQNIKSYQIEIKLPDPAYQLSKDTNITQQNSENKPASHFKNMMDYYVNLYNSDFLTDPIKNEIINLFSNEIIEKNGKDTIIRNLYLMKQSGVNITSYRIDNSFYRLDEGNVKGSFLWNTNSREYETPYEISFIIENGYWKINTFPTIRF